jgi:hypothetical protein
MARDVLAWTVDYNVNICNSESVVLVVFNPGDLFVCGDRVAYSLLEGALCNHLENVNCFDYEQSLLQSQVGNGGLIWGQEDGRTPIYLASEDKWKWERDTNVICKFRRDV